MLRNFKVSSRLAGAFSMLIAILLGIVVLAVLQMGRIRSSTEEVVENWLPSVELVNKMNTNTSDYRIAEISHVLSTSAADMAAFEQDMAGIQAEFQKNREGYEKLISSPEERKLYDTFSSDWAEYQALHDKMIVISRNNDTVAAKAILDGESRRVFERGSDTLLKLVALNHDGADRAGATSGAVFAMARNLMLLAAAAALLLAVFAALWLIRSITRPLNRAVAVADQVAKGDLTARIESDAKDETGLLLAALARMQQSLAAIVGQVRTSCDSIATGASQIASGNVDLSSRTEQQAASLEETAASMEELTSTVKQNADNAHQASSLARDASNTADQGREVVHQVVSTMQEITDSSARIASIINVIDSIAFQTNILALNASVEAARAGDQGRGFAVVAGEVRNLASRSAEAAREIKALIEESSRRVNEGSQLVEKAGATMSNVVSSVKRVTDIIDEISAASREQSDGIAQVNVAVAQMDQVTQQNAALVHEASAASASLAEQAQHLQSAVAVFHLASDQPAVATAAVQTTSRQLVSPRHQLAKTKQTSEAEWETF